MLIFRLNLVKGGFVSESLMFDRPLSALLLFQFLLQWIICSRLLGGEGVNCMHLAVPVEGYDKQLMTGQLEEGVGWMVNHFECFCKEMTIVIQQRPGRQCLCYFRGGERDFVSPPFFLASRGGKWNYNNTAYKTYWRFVAGVTRIYIYIYLSKYPDIPLKETPKWHLSDYDFPHVSWGCLAFKPKCSHAISCACGPEGCLNLSSVNEYKDTAFSWPEGMVVEKKTQKTSRQLFSPELFQSL